MIRHFAIAAAFAALSVAAPVRAADSETASKTLHALFDSEWERGLVESPEGASYNGDNRFNDRWTDMARSKPTACAPCRAARSTRCRVRRSKSPWMWAFVPLTHY